MAIKTQFIDTEYLKENSLIEFNVDDAKLNPLIFKAQDMHLAPVLGSDFYNHLQEAAYNTTLNSDEEALIRDYIQQMVAEWTAYISVNQITNKLTNKSASIESSQYSVAVDRANRTDLKNELRDAAEFYTQRLVQYLCDHSELFSLYINPTAKENLHRNSTAYFCGIYLPGMSGCNCGCNSRD